MSLPFSLQAKLNATASSYPEINLPTNPSDRDVAVKNVMAARLDNALKAQLADSFSQAMSQDWGIQKQTSPLSIEQIAFLRSHTIDEIAASVDHSKTQDNSILNFCVGVLKNVAIQLASAAITQALSEKKVEDLMKKQPQRSIASEGKVRFEETYSPSKDGHSTDSVEKHPSVKTMEKITFSRAQGLTIKTITHEVEDQLKSLGSVENDLFLKHAKITVGSAVASGKFFTKVEEMGWEVASAELAKKVTIDFVAKYSSKILTGAIGCSNPVWCAGVLTKVIVDTLEPTDTAPPSRDMTPPIPPPSLEDVTRVHLPHLNPSYPSIRKPDEGS